jgi:NitT/TauT family transport system permease protein
VATTEVVLPPSDPVLPAGPGLSQGELAGLDTGPASRRRLSAATCLRCVLRLASLVVTVAAWQLLASRDVDVGLRFSKIPAPSEVLTELSRALTSGIFYTHLLASLRRILTGFALATVTGVVVGVAVARSKVAADLLRPVLEVVRPVPAIAWVPLAILLFPTSEGGIVFITYLAAFFPVMVSTQHAVRALPLVWEEAARTMGARRHDVLLRVVLPGSLPGIFSGLSVAMGVAWICVISAEMISGQYGIGYYTWQSYGLINYPAVIVGMLSIGLVGWWSAALIEMGGRRLTGWLPRSEEGGR